MKNKTKILAIALLTIVSAMAQTKKTKQMEKNAINPWEWQDKLGYSQAVEVKNVQGTLYCSGQTATHADGQTSNADMKTQLIETLENLELLIKQSGYECKNIVRLNIYTTAEDELLNCFDVLQEWIKKHGMKQATTLLEVKTLYQTLKVELEATVVK